MLNYFGLALILCALGSDSAGPPAELIEVRFLVLDATGAEAKVKAIIKNLQTGYDYSQEMRSLSGRLVPGPYELTFPDSGGETVRLDIDLHRSLYVITLPVSLMESPKTQLELRYGLKGFVGISTPAKRGHFRVRLVGLGSYEIFDALVAPSGAFYFDSVPLGAYQLLLIDGFSVVQSVPVRIFPYENRIVIRRATKVR